MRLDCSIITTVGLQHYHNGWIAALSQRLYCSIITTLGLQHYHNAWIAALSQRLDCSIITTLVMQHYHNGSLQLFDLLQTRRSRLNVFWSAFAITQCQLAKLGINITSVSRTMPTWVNILISPHHYEAPHNLHWLPTQSEKYRLFDRQRIGQKGTTTR